MKQIIEKVWDEFVEGGAALVVDGNAQRLLLQRARQCRAVDYVSKFTVSNSRSNYDGITTRSNWIFMLTGAACYWEGLNPDELPMVCVQFPYRVPNMMFNTPVKDVGAAEECLVFGREGIEGKFQHFEEYRELKFMLSQRFTFKINVVPKSSGVYSRGYVVLNGLEFDMGDAI